MDNGNDDFGTINNKETLDSWLTRPNDNLPLVTVIAFTS